MFDIVTDCFWRDRSANSFKRFRKNTFCLKQMKNTGNYYFIYLFLLCIEKKTVRIVQNEKYSGILRVDRCQVSHKITVVTLALNPAASLVFLKFFFLLL